MDFVFTEREEAFRKEVRQFLAQELPPGWSWEEFGGFDTDEAWKFHRAFLDKLARKGWLTLSWPREYGGQERPVMEQLVFVEEMGYHRAPHLGMGVTFIGPALMLHGTEEQRREFLPRISRSEIWFCEGFTEPGAGSDLASLQTRAVLEGDEYVVNGQKTFQTWAHRADYSWLAVRTDPEAPKHRGISVLIVDMDSPGITVRPVLEMTGLHIFNEVFFDEVRVSRERLVGEENRGWYMLMTTLNYERAVFGGGAGEAASYKRTLEELVNYVRETNRNGDPLIRHKLAELAIEVEIARLLAYRVAWMQSQGQVPTFEVSIAKVFGGELCQRLANIGMQILGLLGQLPSHSKWAALRGHMAYLYLGSVATTIGAGTSEIQRNMIALMGLGLPRGF